MYIYSEIRSPVFRHADMPRPDISVHYTVLLFLRAWLLFFPLEWELVRMDGLVRILLLPRFPTKLADDVTLFALAP